MRKRGAKWLNKGRRKLVLQFSQIGEEKVKRMILFKISNTWTQPEVESRNVFIYIIQKKKMNCSWLEKLSYLASFNDI